MNSKITRKIGQSGRAWVVKCIQCGKMIPRDKALEKRKSTLPLDQRLRSLLRKKGARAQVLSTTAYHAQNTENMCENQKNAHYYYPKRTIKKQSPRFC